MIVRNSPNSHDFQGLTWYSDYKMNYWTPQHKAKINVRRLQFPLWISAHSCVRYGIQQIWAIKGKRLRQFLSGWKNPSSLLLFTFTYIDHKSFQLIVSLLSACTRVFPWQCFLYTAWSYITVQSMKGSSIGLCQDKGQWLM